VTGHELVVLPDEDALAARAAAWVADLARATVTARGHFTFAVSGGKTPWEMFAMLTQSGNVPWASVEVFQVDERVAPEGDDARNLTHLHAALSAVPAVVRPMPVNAPDLTGAAAAYGRELPAHFDLVHLGLGPDGHTASLTPGDPVLEVTDALVGVTQPYQGHRRMTLTYPALGRAEQLLWLVGGAEKRDALAKLLAGDPSIPAGRVTAPRSTVMADAAAAQ
jgi:6-phosphogluconolactonase